MNMTQHGVAPQRGRLTIAAVCLSLAAASVGSGVGFAQNAPRPADVDSVLAQPQPLNDREKTAYAEETIRELQRGVERIMKDAEAAKKERDILKLNCLNEKLSDLRSILKIAETAAAQMEQAISKAQDEATEHEFQRIFISRKQGADLIIEASACTGEGILQSGEGQTSVTVSTDITGGDVVDPGDGDVDLDTPDLPPSGSVYQPSPTGF